MKSIFSYLLIILPVFAFSQNTIMAEYFHTATTDYFNSTQKSILYADNKLARQSHFTPSLGDEYGTHLRDDGVISIIEKPEDSDINWYLTQSEKQIKKTVSLNGKQQIILDTNLKYDWEITDEIDSIGQYQVIKALTNFRGRTFIAWFAPSVPISFGPWKLKGLPGLILKMYDEDQKFIWTITKLNLNAEFPEDQLKPNISENAKEMTYEEALDMSKNSYDEKQKRISTKLGGRGGSYRTVRHREQDLEIIYEWEEN